MLHYLIFLPLPLQSDIGFGKLKTYTKLEKLGEVSLILHLHQSFVAAFLQKCSPTIVHWFSDGFKCYGATDS